MSVCFLLLKQNAQDWVIDKEREFNVVQDPPARKSKNMAAGSALFWPGGAVSVHGRKMTGRGVRWKT